MLLAGLIAALGAAANVAAAPAPELFLPDIIATGGSEVKAAFTPDGTCVFWGSIPETPDGQGWDILYSCKADGQWSLALRAPFDTPANEFDPAVSPDGKSVWFFSNRPGGLGKDDIWSVSFDQRTMAFGPPVNAGPKINTAGNEWAPVPVEGGVLLFSSDGWGGAGKQDLFFGYFDGRPPINLGVAFGPGISSPEDDFDPAMINEGGMIVFARGDAEGGKARLFAYVRVSDRPPLPVIELPPIYNCSEELNIGPSESPADPGYLYFSAYCPAAGKGRLDIFRVPTESLGDPTWLTPYPAAPHPPAPSR